MTKVALADVDAALAGVALPPRSNGELTFDEPWQARALGMAVGTMHTLGVSWPEWRRHLAAAIADRGYDPAAPAADTYYTAWVDALEALLAAHGMTTCR